jgi:hypothetical protein
VETPTENILNPVPDDKHAVVSAMNVTDGSKPPKKRVRTDHSLLIISLVALTISTCLSVFFFLKWDEAASNYVTILTEKNTVSQRLTMLKTDYDKLYEQMSVLRDPVMKVIPLNSTDSLQHYKAMVYYNEYTSEAYVDAQGLPMPPADMQYQLWATVDSQRINVTMLNMEDLSIQKVKPMARVKEWTITREPKGGSASPTMGQIIALGKD